MPSLLQEAERRFGRLRRFLLELCEKPSRPWGHDRAGADQEHQPSRVQILSRREILIEETRGFPLAASLSRSRRS